MKYNKLYRFFSALFLMFIVVSFNNCGKTVDYSFVKASNTIAGNPYNENLTSLKMLESICSKLVTCHPDLNLASCNSGVMATSGIAEALGLPLGIYSTYSDVVAADLAGALSSNSTSADSCETDIQTLSCSDTLVQGAFNTSLPNPFTNVPQLLPTRSCSSTFQPAWKFVDRGPGGGINENINVTSATPWPLVFNTKLYAAWNEGGIIRVGVYNGNDSAPSWNLVDGGGINYDRTKLASSPSLGVWNNKLFVAWLERDATNVRQVRVAQYNGDDSAFKWTLVDGGSAEGINFNTSAEADVYSTPSLLTFNSKLYITWGENDSPNHIQIAVFDGVSGWSNVAGSANGVNRNSTLAALEPTLVVFNSKLYASWTESNAETYQIRIAVYNGNDLNPQWSFADGNSITGVNVNPTSGGEFPKLIVHNAKLYVAWDELSGPTYILHFKVFNGNDGSPQWRQVDTNPAGSNFDLTKNAQAVNLTSLNGKLYVTWQELDASAVSQVRVAVYNDNDQAPVWSFADGNGTEGLNANGASYVWFPHLTEFNSKLYALWEEADSIGHEIRAAMSTP